jgi:membrane protein YdbS with pleckstrin-like domain
MPSHLRSLAIPEASELRSIHPAIKKVWRFSALVSSIVLTIPAVVAVGVGISWAYSLIAVVGGVLLFVGMAMLADRQYAAWGYDLTDRELIARWGVVWRTARYIPRDAIQHVDVNQGPVDRRNGLAQIQVYTAAAATAAVTIPGLPLEEANALRGQLLPQFDLGL